MEQHRIALGLAERAQSPELTAHALGGLVDAFYAQGRMQSALSALERCIEAARRAGSGGIEIANRPMGSIAECFMMRLDAARDRGMTARALAQQAQNRRAELVALHGLMMAAMEAGSGEEGLPYVAPSREIVAELGMWRFEGENLIFAAQLEALAGRLARGVELAREALQLCRQHSPSFVGALAFGIAATLTNEADERDLWLQEGEALLQEGTLGHNHLYFRRHAIDASLSAGRNGEARRHAIALAKFAEQEPLPFTDIVVRRGLLLADSADGKLSPEGRAELTQLVTRAEKAFFLTFIPEMRAALQQ
jgi:hypothetical protein